MSAHFTLWLSMIAALGVAFFQPDTPTYMRQRPGMSAFIQEGGVVYHTYSTYSRGVDSLWGMYPWLDRAPLGRNELSGVWWRHHDQYDTAITPAASCCQHSTASKS